MHGRKIMIARYPGKCADCGEYWPEGTPIRHVDEGWVHDACSDRLSDVRRSETTCPRCWLVHPKGACDR